MSFKKNLLGAVLEASAAFGVKLITPKAEIFAEQVRRHHNRIAVVGLGSENLIWTKEGGRRKLILQTSAPHLEVRAQFEAWTRMPQARALQKRGVVIELASRTTAPQEVIWGADTDMTPPAGGF